MLWPKFLTYGNWGGPGWSGGVFTDDPESVDWSVEPVDELDHWFKEHDNAYQNGHDRKAVDSLLVYRMRHTSVKGLWRNVYKQAAIIAFIANGWLQ